MAIPSLVAETAHPRFRATATASFSNVYFLGTAVAGWVNFGVTYFDSDWAWRIPFILQCLGCVPIVIWACTPWMVESPRWLVSRGREEDAHRLLAKLHANGDMDDELVVMELCEIKEMVTFENGLPTGVEPYLAFFQTKGNRLRIFLCVFLSFSMAMAGVSDRLNVTIQTDRHTEQHSGKLPGPGARNVWRHWGTHAPRHRLRPYHVVAPRFHGYLPVHREIWTSSTLHGNDHNHDGFNGRADCFHGKSCLLITCH